MEIISDIMSFESPQKSGVALGVFDGMHQGHIAVISESIKGDFLPAVLTFNGIDKGPKLTTPLEKRNIMKNLGVKRIFEVDFNSIRNMQPQDFFEEILVKHCNAGLICCGEDFRFGRNAEGNTETLKRLSVASDIELKIVPAINDGNKGKISSTVIRFALQNGDVKKANELLGRSFSYDFEVIHGNHIGTGLGMPTINQALPEGFILPKFGVYATAVHLDTGEYFYGITNIGVKPTVGSDKVLSETWMPDFKGDLYGKCVRIYLVDFIRPERKFPSLGDMKTEIFKNVKEAKLLAAQSEFAQEIWK